MMRIKRLLAVALFIVLMLAVSACGNKAEDAKSGKSGKKTEDVKTKEDTAVTSSITVDNILQQITEKNDDGATSAPATDTTPASAVPATTEAPRNNDDLSDDGAPEPEPTEVVTPEPTAEPTPTEEPKYECRLCLQDGHIGETLSHVTENIYQCHTCYRIYKIDNGNLWPVRMTEYTQTNNIIAIDINIDYDYYWSTKQILSQEYEPIRISINTDNYSWGFDPDRLEGYSGKGGIESITEITLHTSTDTLHDAVKEDTYDANTHMYTFNAHFNDYPSKLYVIKPIGHNGYIQILFDNNSLSNEDLLHQVIEPMLADVEYEPYVIEQ